ncbi:hypothetical protein H4R19_000797 [Coemansia spiralis]|nr:hypothetical protein H4R19_000797 [Coemansia spiralis]
MKFKTLRRKEGRQPPAAVTPPAHGYAPVSPGGNGNGPLGPSHAPPPPPPLTPSASARAQLAGSATQDDIVIHRLNSWRSLVKAYSEYFTAFAAAQKSAKKALDKSASDFGVPLSGEHYFAGIEHGGVQRLGIQLREMHDMYAAHSSRLVQSIEADTLTQLDELRSEIKTCAKTYTNSLGPAYRQLRKQAKEVEGCKEKLARAVEAHERKGRGPDVWLVRQQVRRELARQADLENALHRAMQAEHARLLGWETMMSSRLRDVIAGVVAGERAGIHACTETADNCGVLLDRFDASTEAQAFDYHFGAALRAPLGLTGHSSLDDYDYMYRDCRAADVLLEGPLERERGLIKRFQPTHVVLTAQGHLHCYADPAHLLAKAPDLSLNLAACAVVPLDDARMFVVVAGDKKLGRSRYAFRGPDPATTEHWVGAISSVAARHSTPPTPVAGDTVRTAPAAPAADVADDEDLAPEYDATPTAARSLHHDGDAPAAETAAAAAALSWERSPEASVAEEHPASRQASQAAGIESRALLVNIHEEPGPQPAVSAPVAYPLHEESGDAALLHPMPEPYNGATPPPAAN